MTRKEHAELLKSTNAACNAIQRAINKARKLGLGPLEQRLLQSKNYAIEAYGMVQAGEKALNKF
jgi:hypothetical protein